MKDKVLLIDGNSIVNRAFYGLPLLTTKKGVYTNAVYGFLNMFLKVYEEEQAKYAVVAFDVNKPTFRHLKYEAYKGTRKGMPEELKLQIPLLKEVLNCMNIKIIEIEGYEADDILGTLAKKYSNELMTIVLSGDRDLLQIADDNIQIKIPKTKGGKTVVESYFKKDVIDNIGVTPQEYIDVKALMGDTSDNIPGVPGIGEKTAIKIIQEYKMIEKAIENAENIKPKRISENLVKYKNQAIQSKELVEIATNIPINLSLEEIGLENIVNEKALAIMKELEFKSLIEKFYAENNSEAEVIQLKYEVVENLEEAKKHIKQLEESEIVAFTSILEEKEIIYVSFTNEKNKSTLLKLYNNENKDNLLNLYKKFFESDINKVTINSKKELLIFEKIGININNIIFDCQVAFYLIDCNRSKYDVGDISSIILNENYKTKEDLIGKGKNKLTLLTLPITDLMEFSARQSDICYRSYSKLKKLLEDNEQLELYYDMELPLIEVLKDMELYGIKVDSQELLVYGEKLQKYIDVLTKEIYELAGEEFNINSPSQLGVILFEDSKLGLKGLKKTKTGYSTNAEVLEKLRYKHPIIPKILEYRIHTKLKSTYVDGLINTIDKKTSKIYSTFNQTVASTGRISSTEPNLQVIPIKLELGRELRKVFIPTDSSYIFIDGDYSQIELRILAHLSGDEVLLNAFNNNEDIHTITASQVFNVSQDKVTSLQRSNAKAVNFGIIYGISAFSLSEDLKITRKEAEEYINGYFIKYPKVKEYLDKTVEEAKEKGYAITLYGRKRYIPELASTNFVKKSFGERVAMNMPIQGTAADIIKLAMINIHKKLKENNLKSRLILQVHDELLIEAKKDELDIVEKILKEEMVKATNLKIPMETECHVGNNLYEIK